MLCVFFDYNISKGKQYRRPKTERKMLYHVETTNGVVTFDRNDSDDRSIKQYFADKNEVKPKPIAVRGYPFANMYLKHGTEENGLFVAVKARQ